MRFNVFLDLLAYKTISNLKAEFTRFYLNYVWWIVEPAMNMIVYYVIFTFFIQRTTANFMLFLLTGTIQWQWFSSATTHGMGSIANSGHIIQQLDFPKYFFPLEVFAQDTVKYLLVTTIYLLCVAMFSSPVTIGWAALPLLILVEGLWIIALTMFFAAIVPLIPDLEIVISAVLRLSIFGSGVFYDINAIATEEHRRLLYMNPIAGIIREFRIIIIDGGLPSFEYMAYATIASCLLLGLDFLLIRKFDKVYPKLG